MSVLKAALCFSPHMHVVGQARSDALRGCNIPYMQQVTVHFAMHLVCD